MTEATDPVLGPAPDVHPDVHVVSPAPREAWRQLLSIDPGALPTQTPEWTDLLCRTRGWTDASRLYEFPGGRRFVLPLLARGAGGRRWSEESMPGGFGYGGTLGSCGEPSVAEARTILADLARRPVLRASVAPSPLAAAGWTAAAPPGTHAVPYLAHVLDLDGGWDTVWTQRFRPRIRRDVRKARQQGLDVQTGPDSGVVAAFAELRRRSVERWARTRGHPLWLARQVERQRDRVGLLDAAIDSLGPMVRTWTARLHGEPVAVNVVLRFDEQAYGWLSVMDQELAQRTQAGVLLLSLAIEDACEAGARWFQLGESDPGSGVAAFKERFGGVPVPWSALFLERIPVTATGRQVRVLARRWPSLVRTPAGAEER
jgi:CelD/BcsL family acetyltransferase involved in cellulose biosynthesis